MMISNWTKAGDVSSDWLPVNRSNGVGCRGLSEARLAMRRQMSASACRGARATADCQPVSQHGGVHRANARGADPIEVDTFVLKETI